MCFFLKIICNLYIEIVFFLEWEVGELPVQKQLGAVCLQGCCLQKVDFAGNEAPFGKKKSTFCSACQRWEVGPEATSASTFTWMPSPGPLTQEHSPPGIQKFPF